jgi:hypothetical protein
VREKLHQIDSKDNQKITIIKMERKVDVFKRNKKKQIEFLEKKT